MKTLNFKNGLIVVMLVLGLSLGLIHNVKADEKTINSNYDWTVKNSSDGKKGPGNNNWSDDANDVFVDDSGLHLKVSQHDDGQWYSSEVYLPSSLGYGKYTFEIDTRADQLDKNLVAAPFLYQDDDHEIDIEHSYWANTSDDTNLYYTVQPGEKSGNQQTQHLDLSQATFQDIIYWEPNKITLSTEQNGTTLASWEYTSSTDGTSDNFSPGSEKVHINFWQYQGLDPLDVSSTHEFTVKSFNFEPYQDQTAAATSTEDTTTSTTETTTDTTSTTVNLNIRYKNNLVFSGVINLASSTIITDDQGNTETTATSTVLTALINAQNQADNFSISDLQNSSYGYYLKCLYLDINTTSTCDNWNYVVNDSYPTVGMGSYVLNGGENIYIYYGDSWRITTDNDTVTTNTSTSFYTWKYDYSNVNSDWVVDPNDLVAITTPNPTPSGWWDTDITVSTTLSNDQGVAYYNFTSTGTFSAKITSEDYSKWSNPISITVTDTPTIISSSTESTTTEENTDQNSGGGNGGSANTNQSISNTTINNSINKIINFLKSKQGADGKIVDGNISDWAAMAFGADNIYANDVSNGGKSLYNFIYNYNFTDNSDINTCASYPRHILALLAAGTDKTDNKIIDLKNKINSDCIKNNKFGQDGINDDVFGLLALLATDENINTTSIQTTFNTILSDQQSDGSFTWNGYSGADITGAAINVLKYAKEKGLSVDEKIFTGAKQYLKSQQLTDGGWGFGSSDALTTSWVVMGLNAIGEDQSQWFNNGKNPWYILTTLDDDHYTQSWDGNIDWFGTKHAVPALIGAHWPIILTPQPTVDNSTTNVSSGNGGSSILSEIATTTTDNTTTTTSTLTTDMTALSTSTIFATTTITTSTANKSPSTTILQETTTPAPEEKIDQTVSNTNNQRNDRSNTVLNTPPTTAKKISKNDDKPEQQLSSGQPATDQKQTIDNLPLDTPTKKNAKKILAVSGGGILALGAYLGLKLLKNVV